MRFINGQKLSLVTLDKQIKEAGGKGFNTSVRSSTPAGSFATHYIFTDEDGDEVTLMTPNEAQLGCVNDSERRFVMFNADTSEYTLETPKNVSYAPYRLLFSLPLGLTYERALANLKKMYPNRLRIQIEHPAEMLERIAL